MSKFLEIVNSPMMNTTSIKRYSGTKLVEEETLSDHIVDCQVMGYMIINYMNKYCSEAMDKSRYLELALHHDLEETITGDVVRTLKYHNPSVLRELQDVASSIAENMYHEHFYDNDNELYNLWSNAKSSGKEGFILKLVDLLSVVNKVIKEVKFLHNYYFLRVALEVNIYLKDVKSLVESNPVGFTGESVNYLSSILLDAKYILDGIIEDNNDMILEYKIYKNSIMEV